MLKIFIFREIFWREIKPGKNKDDYKGLWGGGACAYIIIFDRV